MKKGYTIAAVLGMICMIGGTVALLIIASRMLAEQRALDPSTEWNNKGVAYYQRGEYAEAVEAFQNSIRTRPRAAATWYNLGLAYERLGSVEQAARAYSQAVVVNPDYAKAARAFERLHPLLKEKSSSGGE